MYHIVNAHKSKILSLSLTSNLFIYHTKCIWIYYSYVIKYARYIDTQNLKPFSFPPYATYIQCFRLNYMLPKIIKNPPLDQKEEQRTVKKKNKKIKHKPRILFIIVNFLLFCMLYMCMNTKRIKH